MVSIQPRETLDRQLREIKEEILVMGQLIEEALERAVRSLRDRDLELARQVIQDDARINQQRFKIEDRCFTLIATQQPAARDLRDIISAMILVNEMERMGDHASGIATITLRLGQEPLLKPLIDIPRMKEKTQDMLRRALRAYVQGDVAEAQRIGEEDDEIDELYHQVYRELLSYVLEDPRTVTRATNLLWAAHNIERIADRVTNIAERAIYAATGTMSEFTTHKKELEAPGG